MNTCVALLLAVPASAQCIHGRRVQAADVAAALAKDSIYVGPVYLQEMTFARATDTITLWIGPMGFAFGNSSYVYDAPVIAFSSAHCIHTDHWRGMESTPLSVTQVWNAAMTGMHGLPLDSGSAVALGDLFASSLLDVVVRTDSPFLRYPDPLPFRTQDSSVVTANRIGTTWHLTIETRAHVECVFDARGRLVSYQRKYR